MAKGQKKSNREAKKPKANKAAVVAPSSLGASKAAKPLPIKGAGK